MQSVSAISGCAGFECAGRMCQLSVPADSASGTCGFGIIRHSVAMNCYAPSCDLASQWPGIAVTEHRCNGRRHSLRSLPLQRLVRLKVSGEADRLRALLPFFQP